VSDTDDYSMVFVKYYMTVRVSE